MNALKSILSFVLLGLLGVTAFAEEKERICRFHDHSSAFAIDLHKGGLQYAPDRQVDIKHIKLDVVPDFQQQTVSGTTTLRFMPISKPLEELKLNAYDLTIGEVRSEDAVAETTNTGRHLLIRFANPIPVGKEAIVHIDHSAEPTRGLYFRTPEMGYPETDTHVWTQGEAHEAQFWFPCFDYPNERSSTEVICHVPTDMTVLSNGRRISESIDESGLKRVHWLQEKPHVNYLICLVAGHLKKLEKQHRGIPLGFYVQPSLFEHAVNSFRDTAGIMKFFESEIGVPFPWEKYDQVTILDFVAGGMENTTLTTLTHRTIFSEATENIRQSRRLDAHELAHQWFGDLLTCKDWSQLWLNEGFATYYTHLYEGHKYGHDAMLYGLYNDAKGSVLPRSKDKRPIVFKGYKNAQEQFDFRAYPKGSWVLHMLRSQLGPDLYRQCIRDYISRNELQSVVSDDLRKSFERLSGRTFDRFFDQWVYHAGSPNLKISYRWLSGDRLAKVTVEQTQAVDDHFLLFEFPTSLRFVVGDEVIDFPIQVSQKKEDFFVPLPGQPSIVRFDPEYSVLASVDFKKSDDQLMAQLKNRADMMGRLLAVEALGARKTQKSVEELQTTLNQDGFFGVRIAAAVALGKIHDDRAYQALKKSIDQPDARVRLKVVEQLGKFYRSETLELLQELLEQEQNPAIQVAAIRSLGRYSTDESRQLLIENLKSKSFRDELMGAAISAIEMQRDPKHRFALIELIQSRGDELQTRVLTAALQALAKTSQNEEDRSTELELIKPFVVHPKEKVRIGAIRALGHLRDPRAQTVLETMVVKDGPSSRVTSAAESALKQLQETKPSAPSEVVELRKQLTEMKKKSEELRTEFDEFKSKLESRDAAVNAEKANAEKANAEKANAEKANAEKANAEKANAEKANAEKANAEKEQGSQQADPADAE